MSSEEDKTKVYSDGVVFLHHSVGCAQIPRQAWYLWHPQTKSGAKLFIIWEEPSWRNLGEQVVPDDSSSFFPHCCTLSIGFDLIKGSPFTHRLFGHCTLVEGGGAAIFIANKQTNKQLYHHWLLILHENLISSRDQSTADRRKQGGVR